MNLFTSCKVIAVDDWLYVHKIDHERAIFAIRENTR